RRRRARHERRLLRRRDLGHGRSRRHHQPPRQAHRARARRVRHRLPPLRAEDPGRGMVRRRLVPPQARRRQHLARGDEGAPRAAHRHAAAVAAERRQRVPQSAEAPRRAAHRVVRAERLRPRRCARVGEARELHRQPERPGARGRHRVADPPHPAHGVPDEGRLPRYGSPHRRGGRMNFGKVAVLLGGKSAEREVSLKSGSMVLAALKKKGVDAHPFDPKERDLLDLVKERFARVFIALHGRFGEDGTVQGVLEWLGIPYTGSGVLASALAMDKVRTKRLWAAEGLPTAPYAVLEKDTDLKAVGKRLGTPMFVKPASEGSSVGMTKVKKIGDLEEAYALAVNYDPVVIAEKFINGQIGRAHV